MILTKYQKRIDYWNSKKLRRTTPNEKSKAWLHILATLKDSTNGTGYYVGCPVPMHKFKLSVDRWTEVVFNPKYRPVDKKNVRGMSLGDFIYSKFPPPHNIKFQKSLLYYTENLPESIFNMPRTGLYDCLCQSYVEKNGLDDVESLTLSQCDNIAFASKRLTEFVASHKGKINNTFLPTHKHLTDAFVRHALDHIKGNIAKFSTRALTYNSTWEMLPNFFEQHGYFVATKRKSLAQIEEQMNATKSRPTLKRRGKRVSGS